VFLTHGKEGTTYHASMTAPTKLVAAWEVAGLAFRRPLAAAKLLVPEVIRYRSGRLYWRCEAHGDFELGERRHPSAGLLEAFIRLGGEKTNPGRITRFARQWGLLGICRHGKPGNHGRFEAVRGRLTLVWCLPQRGIGLSGSEPIEPWRHVANELATLMRLASAVFQAELGLASEWRAIGVPQGIQETWGDSLEARRDYLAGRINRMLTMADARLVVRWLEDSPVLELGGLGLYAALVGQLALQLTDLSDHMFCYGCKKFEKGMRLREGRHSYCAKCRQKKIPARDASRKYRRSKVSSRLQPMAPALGHSSAPHA